MFGINTMNIQMNTTLMVVFGALLMVIIIVTKSKNNSVNRYKLNKIMTDNELEFFKRLSDALPGLYIFPQVAMSALIKPTATNQKARLISFRQISQKRVDWAIYSRSMKLVCVVELDDSTHNKKNDALRDAALKTAGVETIRWESREKPNIQQIRSKIEYLVSKNLD